MAAGRASSVGLGESSSPGTPFTQPTIRPQAWKARNVLLVNKPARSQAQLMIGHAIDHLEIEDKWHLKIAIDAFGAPLVVV